MASSSRKDTEGSGQAVETELWTLHNVWVSLASGGTGESLLFEPYLLPTLLLGYFWKISQFLFISIQSPRPRRSSRDVRSWSLLPDQVRLVLTGMLLAHMHAHPDQAAPGLVA